MEKTTNAKKYTFRIVGAIVVFYVLITSWFIVKPGEVAIVLNLGKIVRTVDNGLHFKFPIFESVTRISIRISKDQVTSEAASKDLQRIDTSVALNYGIKRSHADKIFTNFGSRKNLEERIVEPSIQETMKAVTAKFTAEELITQRHIVSDQIREDLSARLAPFGITIEGIAITNFSFSKEFSASVEEKNVAVQKALTAQRDLERIKIEAEQKIATAKAEAESLRVQKTEVTPAMVRLRAIEKWDGHLPQVVSDANLLLDFKDLKK